MYINVSKLTKKRIKPDYFSISILSPSFWVTITIIINLTYLDECVGSTIITLILRGKVHRGKIFLSAS